MAEEYVFWRLVVVLRFWKYVLEVVAPEVRHVRQVDPAARTAFSLRLLVEKRLCAGAEDPDLLGSVSSGRGLPLDNPMGQAHAPAGRSRKVTASPSPPAGGPGVVSETTARSLLSWEKVVATDGAALCAPSKFGNSPGPLPYPTGAPSVAEIGGAWDDHADAGTAVYAGRWAYPALQWWVAGAGGVQKRRAS